MFRKKELINLLIIILILGFVFGFDDGLDKFNAFHWMNNLVKNILLVAFSVFLAFYIQKSVAKSYNAVAEISLWSIRRPNPLMNPLKKLKTPFPLGVVFALFFSVLSNGKFFFTGIFSSEIKTVKSYIGRKYGRVTEYQEALILLSVPFTFIGVILISKYIENSFGISVSTLIKINLWMIIFNMLPVPGLTGGRMFFANKKVFIFSISFIVASIALMKYGILAVLILSMIFSFLIVSLYYYFAEYGGEISWPNLAPFKKTSPKSLNRWRYGIIFVALLILTTLVGLNSVYGIIISIIGAVIISLTYYLAKN